MVSTCYSTCQCTELYCTKLYYIPNDIITRVMCKEIACTLLRMKTNTLGVGLTETKLSIGCFIIIILFRILFPFRILLVDKLSMHYTKKLGIVILCQSYERISGGTGVNAARDQIYMGAPIGVVEIHLRAKLPVL